MSGVRFSGEDGGAGAASGTTGRAESASTELVRRVRRSSAGENSGQRPTAAAAARAIGINHRVASGRYEPRLGNRDRPGDGLVGVAHRPRTPVLAVEGRPGHLPHEVHARVVVGARGDRVRAGRQARQAIEKVGPPFAAAMVPSTDQLTLMTAGSMTFTLSIAGFVTAPAGGSTES